jgi:hypothetical protein
MSLPRWFALIALAGILAPVRATLADEDEKPKKGAVVEESIRTKDGWTLPVTYYKSTLGKDAPVVILLHQEGGNRLVWKSVFAEKIHDLGCAVLAVDLRRHGQAKRNGSTAKGKGRLNKRDYVGMGADIDTVKSFVREEHQAGNLNMRKLAIVAAGMSTPIAVSYAAYDWAKRPYDDAPTLAACTPRGQDVQALILLSPQLSVPGVSCGRAINSLRSPRKNVAVLICHGTQDRDAEKIYEQFTTVDGNKNRMYIRGFNTKDSGTDLLESRNKKLGVEGNMVAFIRKHILSLKIPWADRRPRYKRDDDK